MSLLAEAARETRPDGAYAPSTTEADIERARYLDRPVTERELLDRCAQAVRLSGVRATDTEREDLASELAQTVARKHGTWRPSRRMVSLGYLKGRAAKLAADRADWRSIFTARGKVRTTCEPLPAPADGESLLARAAGTDTPAVDIDADRVADALHLDESGAAVVACALSGYGSALELAAALGVPHATARKRLSRGREAIRNRYPNPADLLDALEDMLTDPTDADTLADLLAAIMRSAYIYRGAAKIDREPRVEGPCGEVLSSRAA